jgi:hypothetical protein
LVVLGEPGAGKTVLAMLFTLGLLADPEPNEPIPVLLPLSSWNPQREHLHTWLANKLLDDYPGLANTASYGPRAATRLIVGGRVLPVLDGLDETPPELHAAAINALDRAIAGGRPLMVTCRSTEYEKRSTTGEPSWPGQRWWRSSPLHPMTPSLSSPHASESVTTDGSRWPTTCGPSGKAHSLRRCRPH